MNRLALLLIALLLFVCLPYSYAEEPIQRDEFVKITDGIFDALDEVETVLSNPRSLKIEGKKALDKLNTAQKKYNRFVSGKWPESTQQKIAASLFICYLAWDMVSMDWNAERLTKAREDTEKARQAYATYRQGEPQKK